MKKNRLSSIIDLIKPLQVLGPNDRSVRELLPYDSQDHHSESLTWLSDRFLIQYPSITKGAIVVSDTFTAKGHTPHPEVSYLIVKNPRSSFQELASRFFGVPLPRNKIESTAIVGEGVTIGKNTYIGHYAVIEDNCRIGENCYISHHVVVMNGSQIGDNVNIYPGTVIGTVGFGYNLDEGGRMKLMPHIGQVVLGDHVEVGANTCIAKGSLGSTVVGENTKIDNLVHVGHNSQIGKNCLIIANAALGGGTKIGDNVWISQSAATLHKSEIASHAYVGMGVMVNQKLNEADLMIPESPKKIKGGAKFVSPYLKKNKQ